MSTIFDKREAYDSLIVEKVTELKKLCHLQKIPMFITLCVANTETETVYQKDMISAATCGYELDDDQIAKHVNVSLGFDTVLPSSDMVSDMDEVEIDDYVEDGEDDDERERY